MKICLELTEVQAEILAITLEEAHSEVPGVPEITSRIAKTIKNALNVNRWTIDPDNLPCTITTDGGSVVALNQTPTW